MEGCNREVPLYTEMNLNWSVSIGLHFEVFCGGKFLPRYMCFGSASFQWGGEDFCLFSTLACIQWQRNKGKVVTDLFEELPLTFQAELSLETYRTMIERVHKPDDEHGYLKRFLHILYPLMVENVVSLNADYGDQSCLECLLYN